MSTNGPMPPHPQQTGQPMHEQYGQQPGFDYGTEPGTPVGPVEAVKRYYGKFVHFTGRASRSEYWWVALYMFLVYMAVLVIGIASLPTGGSEGNDTMAAAFGLLIWLIAVAHALPTIALTVRRLHDAGFSGWTYLINLIPGVGSLIILVFTLMPSSPVGIRFDRR